MAEEKQQEQKFPSEVIDLPSEGKLYPKDSPLRDGKIELKYMTAKEEDILTSQNLITKGVVLDRLLDSLILTPGVNIDDLFLGDKNAVMVAARILAYGPEYTCEVLNPMSGTTFEHTFNLASCPFKNLEGDINDNSFEVTLPVSKKVVVFKLLTGKDEKILSTELENLKKLGSDVSPELTTRLKHSIISVDKDTSQKSISNFVDNMLAKDSVFLRTQIRKTSPDIELVQEVKIGDQSVKVDIPMTANFFWIVSEA
tara:strand:- start:360 stop:1124 length:765 start_codon:yes stop_codon:yes gene_type:complete